MKLKFTEEQKFTQWWLWLILIAIGTLPILAIYYQLILGVEMGNKPMSNWGVVLFSVFVFGLIALFLVLRLKTKITEEEVVVQFVPFLTRRVSWSEIKSAEVVNYGFVGGWGIRLGTKYGTVYNTKGNKGLAIELTNGKKFLIGTQKEDELKKIIEKFPRWAERD